MSRSPGAGGHAVVVGGGMAGLLAARVLINHFERVTLIERDQLPAGMQARKGVPQGRMPHVLMPRGEQIIERLFPGYRRELEAAGAVTLQMPLDALVLTPAGWLGRRPTGWPLHSASRPLFEGVLRRRVRDLPGVTILDGHDVTALLTSPDRRQVTGTVLRRLGDTAGTRELTAELVVDASGRGSRAPVWLTEAGYPTPTTTRVDPDVGYASRVYRIPPDFSADWLAVLLFSKPPSMPRSGYLLPIEDSQWMLGLMGAAGQHPPTDEDGFAAFIRSLRHPIVADVLAAAEPVTPIRAYHGTANQLRHYERMTRQPDRFVILGDAVCAFNPVYGQGITTAAIAAEILDGCLCTQRNQYGGGNLDGLARRFQRRLARRNAEPWMLSTGEDLRFPTTTGMKVNTATRLMHRYLDRLLPVVLQDLRIAEIYLQVFGMLARPTALFAPRVLAAAARAKPGHVSAALPPARCS
ncbi:MAG TPA: FAD-dependent oxidoreductase [Pseudonocardiaceae bacterium]|jgi:2-polyprenyl-6-methoxyphenol hydroxylase-like FAD-dependent oxidoreductase|nr:FAD-dependent oxidoreductase [Pseudonocardiaceae bacterium]